MAKSYVKALYDYHSNEATDLSFTAGAVIHVLNQIDENWIEGEHEGNIGLFPANFVEHFSTSDVGENLAPVVSDANGKTVVANDTYISGEDGVLTFFKGDELTFLGRVDTYWCRGRFAGEDGLFPAHLVDGLDGGGQSPQIPSTAEPRHQRADPTSLQVDDAQPSVDEPHAKALFDFNGLSDFELNFPASAIIKLTNDVDSEWFEGVYNGDSGIFPKSFVKVVVPLSESHPPAGQALEKDSLLYEGQMDSTTTDDVPYAVAVYPFVGETSSELSFREGDAIFLHHWVSPEWIQGECNGNVGIFPSTFVQIEKELPQDFEQFGGTIEGLSEAQDKIVSSLFKTGDQALAIYSYATDIDGDLRLEVGDLIWIEQIIDEEWVLGRKGESVGLCPAVFLELQADGLSSNCHNEPGQRNEIGMNEESFSLMKNGDSSLMPSESKPENIINTYDSGYLPTSSMERSQSLAKSTSLGKNAPKITTAPHVHVTPTSPVTESIPEQPKVEQLKKTTANIRPTSLTIASKPSLAPKPLISPKPDFLKKSVKPVSLPVKPVLPPKPVSSTEKSPTSQGKNWVTFDDQNETPSGRQAKPTPPSRKKTFQNSPTMSYKALLDKSQSDDLMSLATSPESNKPRPVPTPRVDLTGSRSSNSDALSSKIMEQADQFEKSSSRQSSPSLNELRELSKSEKPVPVKRTRQLGKPLTDQDKGNHDQGFPILNNLDEQIRKLNNELQKENKVLSGVEVLVQTVHESSSKHEELQSKKGITERKIQDLKRQLKKTEDEKKRLVKLLAGFSSQEEIHLKIQQLQESIKENLETKNNLQPLLSECEEDDVRNELQDNILFCDEAIKNLRSELRSLEELVAQLEGKVSEEVLRRDVTHRKKVIDEILDTEKSFAQDLNLCLKYFMKQLMDWKVEVINCDLLFGNMDEVAALSSRLLERLKAATQDVDIHDQIIGTCFVAFSEEITVVYGKYCRNHDEAIAFLEKSASDEEIQQYFRKCLQSIREFSNCWDLSSFLIKPVQRILKYPLLLNELLKNTPDEHPDKSGLIKAIEVMTIAANDVNEFKRRKELVQKYQKVEESGLSTKFQKFTWHSVLKKSSRFNQRLTQFTGLVSQTVDEKFNENERLFYQIEKTAKNFIKNTTQYIEQFEDVYENQVQGSENIIDFCKDSVTVKDIDEYNTGQRFIGEDLVNTLKRLLEEEVLSPLNTLVNLFQGPHRLIQKRHDKCLDYDSLSNKIERIKDREKLRQARDELEFARKNYEALNAQLLDELPVLNIKCLKFLKTCIGNFACVHKNFFVEALDQFSSSVQLSVVNSASVDIISEFFSQNRIASHEVFQLAFTTKKSLTLSNLVRTSSPRGSRSNLSVDDKHLKTRSLTRSASESKRKAPLPPTSDVTSNIVRSRTVSSADRSLLVRKTVDIDLGASSSGNSTYVVKYAFNAEAPTELSVNKNNVVRVLQNHDAFGHSEWWKVEHNGKIGFVPSSFLAPYSMVPLTSSANLIGKGGAPNISGQTGLPRANQTNIVSSTGKTSMSPNTSQTSMVLKSGQTGNGNLVNMVEYFVTYDFEPHGPSELGVVKGDLVRVLKESDSSGSKDWWLVEARGKQGYVPASYLGKR